MTKESTLRALEPIGADRRYEPGERIDPAAAGLTGANVRQLVEAGAAEYADNPPKSPAEPSGPAAGEGAEGTGRQASISAAAAALDRSDATLFTAAGKPTLAALRGAGAPADVTAAERDAAWAAA
ncbi:MAG: hypothetical protein OXI51_10790 [Chloroflexota bacterium]|nr:hypothetical protein [Chloroflexota bacterium]